MADDFFRNLSNIGSMLSGLLEEPANSGIVPADTQEDRLPAAQSDITGLQKKENDLLIEIGRQAYTENPSVWPQDEELKLISQSIVTAQVVLSESKQVQEDADAVKAAEESKRFCPECGSSNADGIKFCHECGATLASVVPEKCVSCGAVLSAGIRFCGICGEKQG